VILEGLLRIIFKELDSMWLLDMWRGEGGTRRDIVDIIHMLYLLKTRS
jgi:hypothetical protein